MLYADEQIILAETEEELQIAANTLKRTALKYNMKISTAKTKCMAIYGKKMQRAKIVIDGTIIGQVMVFIYLLNMISEFKTDMAKKTPL
jgi:hypothetical protein